MTSSFPATRLTSPKNDSSSQGVGTQLALSYKSASLTGHLAPTISAPAEIVAQLNTPTGVAQVAVSDLDEGATVTVTVSDAHGLLAADTQAAGGGGTITGVGSTRLTISGALAQVNADLTRLSDEDPSLTPDTITVVANASAGGVASPKIILVGHTFTLINVADTVSGGPAEDVAVATSNTLSSGDKIDGGGGSNTLALEGPGTFNLALPTTLTNIRTITATEGQAAYSGGGQTFGAQNQIVVLLAALNATVNVQSDESLNGTIRSRRRSQSLAWRTATLSISPRATTWSQLAGPPKRSISVQGTTRSTSAPPRSGMEPATTRSMSLAAGHGGGLRHH